MINLLLAAAVALARVAAEPVGEGMQQFRVHQPGRAHYQAAAHEGPEDPVAGVAGQQAVAVVQAQALALQLHHAS